MDLCILENIVECSGETATLYDTYNIPLAPKSTLIHYIHWNPSNLKGQQVNQVKSLVVRMH